MLDTTETNHVCRQGQYGCKSTSLYLRVLMCTPPSGLTVVVASCCSFQSGARPGTHLSRDELNPALDPHPSEAVGGRLMLGVSNTTGQRLTKCQLRGPVILSFNARSTSRTHFGS